MKDVIIKPAMFTHSSTLRVNYADTDQMGFVHHSNYIRYYETARWEALRQIGICYKEVEENGILMPVISMKIDYLKPAYYDDLLTIKTMIRELPKARMHFEYEMFNEHQILINSARITMAFINKNTHRPCLPPSCFSTVLKQEVITKPLPETMADFM